MLQHGSIGAIRWKALYRKRSLATARVQPTATWSHLLSGCDPHACMSAALLQALGRIHVAAFSDSLLHNELVSKALFWQQNSFYGIDMTPLHQPALDGYFTQVCAGAVCCAAASPGRQTDRARAQSAVQHVFGWHLSAQCLLLYGSWP